MRHSRLGYIHAGSQIRISCERFRIIRFTSQHTARCRCPPCSIDFFKLRFDFKQSRPPRQSICFERWRHGKTDGFVGARLVSHHQIRGKWVESEFRTFRRRIEGFQIDSDIGTFGHLQTPSMIWLHLKRQTTTSAFLRSFSTFSISESSNNCSTHPTCQVPLRTPRKPPIVASGW